MVYKSNILTGLRKSFLNLARL